MPVITPVRPLIGAQTDRDSSLELPAAGQAGPTGVEVWVPLAGPEPCGKDPRCQKGSQLLCLERELGLGLQGP